ncbi:DUF421 domain-containing protein [Cytobacillus suaedae]|nr:DUF421 domain-containing protein [Cytobacillus suaedae]
MNYGTIAFELVASFVALYILTKIVGRTSISQITPFDFISALVLGEIVGSGVFDKEITIWHILFGLLIWGGLVYLLEIISQKFMKTRSLLEGQPVVVIHKGLIQREKLKQSKLDIDQLQHLLRSKGTFSVRDVEYAILEADGSLSVLNKANFDPPSRKDHNMPNKAVFLPITLISDGEIIRDNLKEAGFDESWLKQQIKSFGAKDVKEVLYAEWREGEGLFVQRM